MERIRQGRDCNSVYLTVVHIFNKLYDFLLVVVKDGVPTEFQIDNSQTKLISPLSSRRKLKDSQSFDSRQYEQKMEKTFKAVTKFFESATNDSHSKGRNLQQCTNLVSSMENICMLIKNYEDDISSLEEKKRKLEQQDVLSSIESRGKKETKNQGRDKTPDNWCRRLEIDSKETDNTTDQIS